jgi:hypothetical protein
MCGVPGVVELLKQSRSGQLQRVEALLLHTLFACGLSFGRLLPAGFSCFNLIGNRLASPATSHVASLYQSHARENIHTQSNAKEKAGHLSLPHLKKQSELASI